MSRRLRRDADALDGGVLDPVELGVEPHRLSRWDDNDGCGDGLLRFAAGLALVVVAVVVILAAGWVRSDRAVARCIEHPDAVGCTPPAP